MEKEPLEQLVNQGLSQRKIAIILNTSQTNIRWWLYRHNLKTSYKKHTHSGARYEERECKHHGMTTFILVPSSNSYRCRKCRSGKVNDQRRELKREAVEYLGGKCSRCGYNKSIWALHFHHKDKKDKVIEVAHIIRNRKRKMMFDELNKCELVCANCHAEIEHEEWELGVDGASRLREEQKD